MKRVSIIKMRNRRYIVVNHLDGKYNHVALVLTPREYGSGLVRGEQWKKQKERLMEVM